jgi:hypothetical protein
LVLAGCGFSGGDGSPAGDADAALADAVVIPDAELDAPPQAGIDFLPPSEEAISRTTNWMFNTEITVDTTNLSITPTPPTSTPSNVTRTNAALAPRKIESFDAFGCADIVITASCVLSPSSAKKRVKNAVPKSFHSISDSLTNSDRFSRVSTLSQLVPCPTVPLSHCPTHII